MSDKAQADVNLYKVSLKKSVTYLPPLTMLLNRRI